ncbi:hypothetical protein V5799_007924 [Amblyomma americanum]|uniref:Netrin module non-TIMP type domain-containing protein n=1 Tax=Amblyomma americanum TaxID=6943 RepID=A0AAQ4FG73_AMBAM
MLTTLLVLRNSSNAGTESEEDLLNKRRVVKARENCETFELMEGSQYIIMGMDAEYKETDRFGDEQYVYVIGSDSVVIPVERVKASRKKGTRGRWLGRGPDGKRRRLHPEYQPCDLGSLVAWFINEFSDDSKRCFT